jgi:hypothetical protein
MSDPHVAGVAAPEPVRPTLPDRPPPSALLGWIVLAIPLLITVGGGGLVVWMIERSRDETTLAASVPAAQAVTSGSSMEAVPQPPGSPSASAPPPAPRRPPAPARRKAPSTSAEIRDPWGSP